MTTKLHEVLTSPSLLFNRSGKCLRHCQQIFCPRNWSSALIGGCLVIAQSNLTLAQPVPLVVETLPPPPVVPKTRIPAQKNPHTSESRVIATDIERNSRKNREYTFKAPLSSTNPRRTAKSYRVEVYGNSQRTLNQVKSIVPSAFRKAGVIQVGIFQHPQNAQDMLLQLASRGLWARIVTVDRARRR
ncbi:MAG: SPOR domain-containing protein [Prochloraceae cyanobacterium]